MALEQEVVSLRSGTTTEWTNAGTVLGVGELGLDLTTNDLKIGDGSTAFASLKSVGEVLAKGTSAAMVAGTVTVTNTLVAANSIILLTAAALGTVTAPKALAVTARSAGVSFTITSADNTDTSTVAWVMFQP